MSQHPPVTDETVISQVSELMKACQATDYATLSSQVHAADTAFRTWVATTIAGVLSKTVSELPHDSLQDKSSVAGWVNSELRSLGLALKCPRTQKPALLRADHGMDDGHGRFQLRLAEDNNQRTVNRGRLSDILPFELMPDSFSGHKESTTSLPAESGRKPRGSSRG